MFKLKRRTHPVFIEDDDWTTKSRKPLRLRFILLLLVVLFGGWAWHSSQADALDEFGGGQLLSASPAAGEAQALVNIANKTAIKVSGMVAHVAVEQRFINKQDDWLEAVYVFPLPDKAAVHRMRIKIGDRVISGHIKEKSEAKAIYQQAKAEGKKAALVKQYRPNLFKTTVANIPPGETIVVELDYIEPVDYQHGEFQLRFPLAITPRYLPVVHQADDHQQMETLMMDYLGWSLPQVDSFALKHTATELTVELDMGLALQRINSAYHSIQITPQKNNLYQIKLDQNSALLQQDFVLRWQTQVGQAPEAAIFKERVDGKDFVQLMLLPPPLSASDEYLPREVIYVIDTSGSMQGPSIIQARNSLLLAIDKLNAQDRFNIFSFNNKTSHLFTGAVAANQENLLRAKHYVNNLKADGGTEMMPALRQSLAESFGDERVRQIIFITDGAVSNEAELFKVIHQRLGDSRLFTVGIGAAPNSFFMRKAAQFGRGTFTHIGNVNEVQVSMTQLLNKLNAPVMSDIQVSWPKDSGADQYPQKIPDLYAGEPLQLSAALQQLPREITVSGKQAGKHWEKTLTLAAQANHQGISTLWAREKIQHLLDKKITGWPEQEVRQSVLDIALSHQLMSPYTSFVAVEADLQEPLNTPEMKTIAIPKTSTRAMLSLLWGLGLFGFFLVIKICLSRDEDYE
ncbi:marine proteobacterial sortase target protein [Oceanicoccus sp. KOV_DT_Chl]|uniref:marine proteobacterial sortase target protein n=1 Tax=Oceanicoccus sp. KOV_DT_Chl TaxID=1904639 RepID=UPI000C7B0BF2|nr:marine proteobacterial sortase target protein [Oceanicoccus sp. KOV_DT_Chl]